MMVEHLGVRPNLNMDQLHEMRDLRPRCETPNGLKLPGDSRGGGNRIWFFSVDGTLRGNRFNGCLFAGECIMVQAKSFEQAFKLARDGLHETIELALQFMEEQAREIVQVKGPIDDQFLAREAGGRRAGANLHAPDLATDPKLKALLRHKLGGTPWRGW